MATCSHHTGTLGMGQLQLTGTMPSGHTGTLMPQRMYYIDTSHATPFCHETTLVRH